MNSKEKTDGIPILNFAVRLGNLELLKAFAAKRANFAAADNDGIMSLHEAVYTRNLEKVKFILEHTNADVNATTPGTNTTPLHASVGRKFNPDIPKFLIEHGAEIKDLELAKNLFSKASKINDNDLLIKINDKGYSFQFTTKTTPEIKQEDKVDEVDILKQATLRARLDIQNPSILHTAVIENNKDNVTEFANKESVMLTDANIRTPLFYAVHMGNIDLAEILIKANPESVNICDKDGNSPLHRAVEANDIAMAKLLIANNANVNAQNLIRQSPLHITINKDDLEKGNLDINKDDLEKGNLDMVKLLNTNEKITTWDLADKDGNTPLHCACRPNYKNPDMVNFLIGKDVNVNAQNLKGETPLYCAIHTPGNEEVVKILLKRNVDVLIKSNAGVSPVDQIKSWIAEVEKIVGEKIQDPTLEMLVAKEREQKNITSKNAIDIKPKEMNQTTASTQGIDRKERTNISALLTQQIVTTPEKKNNYLGIASNQLKSPNATNKPTYKLPTNGRPPSGKMPDRKNLTDFER